jgi:glycosyltransferase involved in cell wall biosynthesis
VDSKELTPLRIFLGLGDTVGCYSRLENGLKSLRVECEFVDAYPVRDYARLHRPGRLGRLVEWLGRKRWKAPQGSFQRLFWKVPQAVSLVALLIRSVFKFDVFVFAGGVSFLMGFDLPVLRLLGKRIIVVYHGTDCRPPYINGAYVGADATLDIPRCIVLTRRIRRWVRWVDRHADVIVNHPYFSHFNTRPIVSWLSLGNPFECPVLLVETAPRRSCVIVHAPTRPVPKGSVEIEAAVNRLRARGHDLTFVKIVGKPPQDVLDALATCDFVIDELYGDTPMAGFATEAAVMGKPAIVGMHDVESLRRTVPEGMFPPALVCHPAQLDEAIEKLVVDGAYRTQLGAQARDYVRDHWSPKMVASRLLQLAAGPVPREWTFDPATLRYIHGWGLTTPRLREVVSAVVADGGVEALQLADKPELEAVFRALVASTTADGRDALSPAS